MLRRSLRTVAIASVTTAAVTIGVATPAQAQPPQAPVKLRAIPAENPSDPSQPPYSPALATTHDGNGTDVLQGLRQRRTF